MPTLAPRSDGVHVPASVYIDQCIDAYITRCRERIPQFADSHFSWRQTWDAQLPSLGIDLLIGPLNAAWSVPFLGISKLCSSLDSLGVPGAGALLRALPNGVRTGYERTIDTLVANQLLGWQTAGEPIGLPGELVAELEQHPAIAASGVLRRVGSESRVAGVLENFSSARILVASTAGTLATIALGWLLFNNTSLAVTDLADRLARQRARSRAASRFVLGRPVGTVFYSVFRPSAGAAETLAFLAILLAIVSVISLACAVASDPLRRAFGLHQRRLTTLVDGVERELLLIAQKRIKPGVT